VVLVGLVVQWARQEVVLSFIILLPIPVVRVELVGVAQLLHHLELGVPVVVAIGEVTLDHQELLVKVTMALLELLDPATIQAVVAVARGKQEIQMGMGMVEMDHLLL
jgi:hypothetical protein